MKTTLRPLIFSLIFTGICFAANAQSLPISDSLRIAVGASIMGDNGGFGTSYKVGTGVFLGVDVPLNKRLYVTASAGFNNFFTSAGSNLSPYTIQNIPVPNFETIPLKLGVKWFLFSKFYFQGEAGETVLANKSKLYALNSSVFTYSPGFGLLFPLKKPRTYIETGVRFENVGSYYNDGNHDNFYALHVAYAFNL